MKKTLLFAMGLCAVASMAAAQAAAPAPPARPAEKRPPRLAVIDMQKISSDTVLGKAYAAKIDALENQIKSEQQKKQTELQKIDAGIKALQDELEKQASVLSAEAADKKRQDITRKTRERAAFLEDGQQELQRMRERAEAQAQGYNAEFQQKIKPSIDAVAKDLGVDIILTSQVAITLNSDYDISREVIAKSDTAERASAAAKPAAAAPAAAGPSPAAPAPKPSPTN